jgi:beta-glucosidase
MTQEITFPAGFMWGAASSAYQVEGAWNEDGRGPSIWDTFSHTHGKTYLGQTGDVAADEYHRWKEDIQLMRQLGLKVYRFSIAWPRVLPSGVGPVNQAGLDFYERFIDCLLENQIEPVVTLYHYDLPQALQDQGGWENRETAFKFADYASILADHFSDRVTYWITQNEPFISAMNGHLMGDHAPGIQDIRAALYAIHHLMLSHGTATEALRKSARRPVKVGIALNLSPVYPASDSDEDQQAADRFDTLLNKITLEPIFHGAYPEQLINMVSFIFPKVEEDDMRLISAPLDFLGVNYYTRAVIAHSSGLPMMDYAQVQPPESSYSQMWEIYPEGLYSLLLRLHKDYQPANIIVTENGIPVADAVDADGKVRDNRRIQYLQDHLISTYKAIQAGAPVGGYFVWSLLDNFEWALGYQMRYGLIHVDFENQKRAIKNSGTWYSKVIAENGFNRQAVYSEYKP